MKLLQVEIQIRKLYCISRALAPLPINLEDAARSETEIENALKVIDTFTKLHFVDTRMDVELSVNDCSAFVLKAGEQLVRVNQDTRLNNRVLDIRTPANQAIFRIQSHVSRVRYSSCDLLVQNIVNYRIMSGSSMVLKEDMWPKHIYKILRYIIIYVFHYFRTFTNASRVVMQLKLQMHSLLLN